MKKLNQIKLWIVNGLGLIFLACIIVYCLAFINELKDVDMHTVSDQIASVDALESKLLQVFKNKQRLQSVQILNGDIERITLDQKEVKLERRRDPLTGKLAKLSKATAFAIHQKHYFLTAEHCIDDGADIFLVPKLAKLTPDNIEACRATLVWKSEKYDLALLYAPGLDLIPMKLAKSRSTLGSQVTSIGQELAVGVIQEVQVQQDQGIVKILHTTPVVQGDSGGAILNNKGKVIAVNAQTFENRQIQNFRFKFIMAALKLQPYPLISRSYMLSSDKLQSIIDHHKRDHIE